MPVRVIDILKDYKDFTIRIIDMDGAVIHSGDYLSIEKMTFLLKVVGHTVSNVSNKITVITL